MNEDDAREFSENLSQIGQGWYRQIAWAFRMEIPAALGLERRQWAETYHGYLKLAIPERREAVAELAADGMSQREIADALGVGQATVARDLSRDPDESPETIEERPDQPILANPDPDESPVAQPTPEELAEVDQQVSDRAHEVRLGIWADNVREAMRRLARMAGSPIPPGLQTRLSSKELNVLMTILDALGEGDYGFLE